MRKLAALVFLVALAFAVWAGARWFAHRGEVKAHIVFRDPGDLRRGDPVIENGVVVGRVIAVGAIDDKTAVTVRLDRDHRRAIVTDSLFRTETRKLIVENAFAIGSPLEDGAVIEAREGLVSQWLARNAGAVRPYLDRIRGGTDALLDEKLEAWSRKVPEWKRKGAEGFEKGLEEAARDMRELEAELRNAGQSEEAGRARARFEEWRRKTVEKMKDVRKDEG